MPDLSASTAPGDELSRELIIRVREHFVSQFEAFVLDQRSRHVFGASEMKLRLGGDAKVYNGLYSADFLTNELQSSIVDFRSDRVLTFERVSTAVGGAAVTIDGLRWDATFVHHDLPVLPDTEMDAWFTTWFDPDNMRDDSGLAIKQIVHAMTIEPFHIHLDFGTAPADAFWSLLSLLSAAGASMIRVSATPA
jgi:hypothetical protein